MTAVGKELKKKKRYPADACPCEIADEPCHPQCACVHPWSSRGCLCCARHGSDEQRKAKAERIVAQFRVPQSFVVG